MANHVDIARGKLEAIWLLENGDSCQYSVEEPR